MDILAIAALEAFDGSGGDEKAAGGQPPLMEPEKAKQALVQELQQDEQAKDSKDGQGRSVEASQPVVAQQPETLDEKPHPTVPAAADSTPAAPPRLSASLANILSNPPQANEHATLASTTKSPARDYVTVPLPSSSRLPPDMATFTYYGPPQRLSEDNALIRCICPYDDDDGFTIQCERCFAWLHGLCVDISPETVPDIYTCPLCLSGGKILRAVEARAARLQQLRKEAENGLRRQRTYTASSVRSAGSGTDLALLASEQDEEYELLAKARGLAYQKSLDQQALEGLAYPTAQQHHLAHGSLPKNSSPTASAGPTPFYQREQLPVQQHTLGPSPFPQQPPSQPVSITAALQVHQHPIAGKRAASIASDASGRSGPNKRAKSQSPGGPGLSNQTTLSDRGNVSATSGGPTPAPARQRKRHNQASLSVLPSLQQNVASDFAGSPATVGPSHKSAGYVEQDQGHPPPPKKRRSASAKERERTQDSTDITAPTSHGPNDTTAYDAGRGPVPQQPSTARKTRQVQAVAGANGARPPETLQLDIESHGIADYAGVPGQPTGLVTQATPAMLEEGFSDDDDSGQEDRYDPWQYEYTPVTRLIYKDGALVRRTADLVDEFVEEERENFNPDNASVDENTSNRASPFVVQSRPGSTRPSLLGSLSIFSGQSSRNRTASPVPSSGSSTPAYPPSSIAATLAAPCYPVILADPSVSPVEASSKLLVKPLPTASMSLAPPACTPFSGPTCVPSLMNPYPRPTMYGLFTSVAYPAGSLITFMHGEVLSGSEYRRDPVNQWQDLGVLKTHTRGISQPWDMVLDQRRFADETRFIRNGCHPNVVIRPVIVSKRSHQQKSGKKGKSAARRKTDQQKAIREGDDFELAFGLYATQDLGKRDELVLPFDWADDHVIHSLHSLLFTPSLVFPSIPSNVHSGDSETEDDGIPSTSSFTYLSAVQKAEIAQCSKHLYRLSRMASQTCLTLFGTTICACEKRRDCAVAWLWKLACFSESSSARSRGMVRLQDFDLNGLRAACASALATDEKDADSLVTGGRASNKKASRKRRADLGSLLGISRNWEAISAEPLTAVPPRAAEEDVEVGNPEVTNQDHMDLDNVEDSATEMHVDIADETLKIRPEIDLANDSPEHALLQDRSSHSSEKAPTEEMQSTISDAQPNEAGPAVNAEPQGRVEEERNSQPSAQEAAAANVQKPTSSMRSQEQAEEGSESDVTEPLPSDDEDQTSKIAPTVASVPAPPVPSAQPKAEMGKASKVAETILADADDDENVRPPKKKKRSEIMPEVKKTKQQGTAKTKKREISEPEAAEKPAKKKKNKSLLAKAGDAMTTPKDKGVFGSGLPSFVTKKQLQARQLAAAAAAAEEATKAGPASIPEAGGGQNVQAKKPFNDNVEVGETSSSQTNPALQLQDLFSLDTPAQAVQTAPLPTTTHNKEAGHLTPLRSAASQPDTQIPVGAATQLNSAVAPPDHPDRTIEDTGIQSTLQPKEMPGAGVDVPEVAPLRRVSFQAYKKRAVTLPKAVEAAEPNTDIVPATSGTDPSTFAQPKDVSDVLSPPLNTSDGAVTGKTLVETPSEEKPAAQAEMRSDVDSAKTSLNLASQVNNPASVGVSTAAPELSAVSPATSASALPPGPAKSRLSFAAYRNRLSTVPPIHTAATPTVADAAKTVASTQVTSNTAKDAAPSASSAPIAPSTEAVKLLQNAEQPASPREAGAASIIVAKEEQEEGELLVDPSLEPGEVETDKAIVASTETAQDLDVQATSIPEESYTPPSRTRSLSPRLADQSRITGTANAESQNERNTANVNSSGDAKAVEQGNTSRTVDEHESSVTGGQDATSGNASWSLANRQNRAGSPTYTNHDVPPTGPRFSSRGSPPSRPRGFSRSSRQGSPPAGRGSPYPFNSRNRPPPGPRGGSAGGGGSWGNRGRGAPGPPAAPSSRDPHRDSIHGGGFGSAGTGGSSYRPGQAPSAPPPTAPRAEREPPSGPRALQGPPIHDSRPGRGRGRFEGRPPGPPRDKGWGGRGRGRGFFAKD